MNYEKLISQAIEARENAYSPYSGFAVGAALLAKSGKVYLGANIENAAFSPTICAERSAFAAAVSAGEREFEAIAVVGGKRGEKTAQTFPCGVCRQVMKEFCTADFKIIAAASETDYCVKALKDILPFAFGSELSAEGSSK